MRSTSWRCRVVLLLVSFGMAGCGASFDVHALEAPRLATGRVRTTDGRIEDVPESMQGQVRAKDGRSERFSHPEDIGVVGPTLYLRRESGTIVTIPVAEVERVEIIDEVSRRDAIILTVVGSALGAAAIIGSLAYVSTHADPW